MSRFAPVHLSEDRKLGGKVSQTMLRHMARCPRSAYLYAANKGEAQNDAMVRGSAAHAIFERSIKLAIENGEQTIPPELVRVVLAEVLAEFPVPWHEQDILREMTWRWASEWALDPAQVVACETLYVLNVGGWEVRAKVDFAELRGQTLYVCDWKTGRGAPSLDESARKRKDGTFLPRTFQLCLYSLAIKYGQLADCTGAPAAAAAANRARAQDVIAEFIYPSIENAEGRMLRRTMGLTSLELTENLESLTALIGRLATSERTGDWPAIVSGPGCSECPAPSECPIPLALRDHNGEITSVEQAATVLAALDVQSAEASKTRAAVKSFAKENDVEIRFGGDKVARFVYSKTEKIKRDAVLKAIAEERPLTAEEALSVSESTNFKDVTMTQDELAEEAGEEQHG